jgi:vancomycin resistance protein YoaR
MNLNLRSLNWRKCLLICLPVVVFGLPVAVSGAFLLAYQNRIYPKTQAAGIKLDGLTVSEADQKLKKNITVPEKLELISENETWEIDGQKIKLKYNFDKTAEEAYQKSRQLPITKWLKKTSVNLNYQFDKQSLENEVATIAGQINQPAIPPQINFNPETNVVEVTQGKEGKELDIHSSLQRVINQIKIGKIDRQIPLIVDELNHLPSERQMDSAQKKAEKLIGKNLTLTSDHQNFVVEDEQLINFVGFNNHWKEENILEYLEVIGQTVEQEPQNAKFEFKEGQVEVFQPSINGIKLNKEEAVEKIINSLDKTISEDQPQISELPLIEEEPEIKTSATNRFGIKNLLGKGESYFQYSSASRIHNVDLASSKFNGILIEPGETFSFNETIGEISQKTGYQQAYIIKNGQTILGTGGGVCQVSTTMFRTALQSGLPIVERRPHAYRVSYYEQNSKAGFDATVYSPSPDLKFKNDTPEYILIQREIDKKENYLSFEFYGTDDGRQTIIENARVWDVVPPPEPKYVDDASLAPGETKQIEHAAWGAKAAFDWKVTKEGKTIHEKTFFSHYRPWQAVYLRGIEN